MPGRKRGFGGSTSAWNTAGDTLSVKNACAMYELTEHDFVHSDPPIECKRRSSYGSSYAVVKHSDCAALKKRLTVRANEKEKQDLIAKHGQAGYDAIMVKKAAEKAKALAEVNRKEIIDRLVRNIEDVFQEASSHGVSATLEGLTITKTNAKKDWYVDVDKLPTPIDDSKKTKKYRLSDVIGASLKSGHGMKLRSKMEKSPEQKRFYARYQLDTFVSECQSHDDPSLQTDVYARARLKIAERVIQKKAELEAEQQSLRAFCLLVGPPSSADTTSPGTKTNASSTVVTPPKKRKTCASS